MAGIPAFRIDIEQSRHPRRRFEKRSFGLNRTGLWGMIYPTVGTGIMLDSSTSGWVLSAAICGRAGLIGWQNKQ